VRYESIWLQNSQYVCNQETLQFERDGHKKAMFIHVLALSVSPTEDCMNLYLYFNTTKEIWTSDLLIVKTMKISSSLLKKFIIFTIKATVLSHARTDVNQYPKSMVRVGDSPTLRLRFCSTYRLISDSKSSSVSHSGFRILFMAATTDSIFVVCFSRWLPILRSNNMINGFQHKVPTSTWKGARWPEISRAIWERWAASQHWIFTLIFFLSLMAHRSHSKIEIKSKMSFLMLLFFFTSFFYSYSILFQLFSI
jgi:hypothetical protein